VRSPLDWPGVHCAWPLANGKWKLDGWWDDQTAAYRARMRGEKTKRTAFRETETLTLSPLPLLAALLSRGDPQGRPRPDRERRGGGEGQRTSRPRRAQDPPPESPRHACADQERARTSRSRCHPTRETPTAQRLRALPGRLPKSGPETSRRRSHRHLPARLLPTTIPAPRATATARLVPAAFRFSPTAASAVGHSRARMLRPPPQSG